MKEPGFLAAAILLAAPQPALAQDDSGAHEIVVTGTGLAAPPAAPAYDTTEFGSADLASSASGRIEDVLGGVAGFQQFRRSDSRSANPSAQGVTLRALGGNATSRSLVLLDGVPMADPFFGYIPLSALAPERLARVRVTRGGGSGAFGAGAVAGTIELDSAGTELGTFNGQALLDDRGESELSGTYVPQLGAGFAMVSGRWDRGQGFWTTPVSQRVPSSVRAKYDGWSVALRGVAPLAPDVELQASGLAFGDARTLRFAGADSTSSGEQASLRVVGKGLWQFDALAYLQARNFSNVVISSTSFRKTLDQRSTPSTGWGGKLELRPPLSSDAVLRLGTDWRISDGTMFEDAYSTQTGLITARRHAGGRSSDLGFYAETDWKLGALTLTGGLRGDRWAITGGNFVEANTAGTVTTSNLFPDRSGWQGSVRGGAVLGLGGHFALRGSAYTGLRLPTLNELYRPFTVFPVTTRANAALVNERLVGFEAGFDWKPVAGISLSATAFDNKVENAIANVTISPILRERRNVDAIHARGLELGLEARRGTFGMNASLALTDAKVKATGASAGLNGKRPAQTPKIDASATLSWEPSPKWRLAMTLRHTGAQYEDDLQTDLLKPATTLDAFAAVPLGHHLQLVLRGENLTDTDVVTRNQAGSIDLGTPRTLWAGLRISM